MPRIVKPPVVTLINLIVFLLFFVNNISFDKKLRDAQVSLNVAEYSKIELVREKVRSTQYQFKNISVLIKDKRNVTLDFGGAMLKFHGRILPFVVDGCDNVTLKNFTINYDRTFYSQADIISVDGRELVIRMDEGFPYEIRDGGLVFTSDTWENDTCDCWVLMQEFDASTKSLALDSILRIGRFGKKAKKDPLSPLPIVLFTVEDLGDRFIRLIAGLSLCSCVIISLYPAR